MVYFKERQTFDTWVLLLLLVTALIIPVTLAFTDQKDAPAAVMWISLAMTLVIFLIVGTMQTEVHDDKLVVSFGLLNLIKFRFEYSEILAVRRRTYRPLAEYGGWGIKGMGPRKVLNMRGKHGVELYLTRTNMKKNIRMMIGSSRSEELVQALLDRGVPVNDSLWD